MDAAKKYLVFALCREGSRKVVLDVLYGTEAPDTVRRALFWIVKALVTPKDSNAARHVERALSVAGKYAPWEGCSGTYETLVAIFSGTMFENRHPCSRIGNAVVYDSGSNMTLVVAPPAFGDETSANVKPLVSMAVEDGWNVVVHARPRGALADGGSFRACAERARLVFPGTRLCLIGLSIGAYEACKSASPYPLVSVSNVYDVDKYLVWYARAYVAARFGSGMTCVEELRRTEAPTLVIHSLNDPMLSSPDVCREIAMENPNVARLTTPSGGHLGFVDADGRRWAYRVALEFLRSALV